MHGAFFAAQLEAAKLLQDDLFQRWKKAGQGKFLDALDRKTVLRPKIDKVSREFLARWGRVQPFLGRPETQQRIRGRGTAMIPAVPRVRERALSPLVE